MPDRIARPSCRLKGGLPDGRQLNGIVDVEKHFLRGAPDPRYGLVRLGRRQLIHDDEAGSDVAVLEVLEIEVPPGEAGQLELERMILAHRDQRTADGTLPFHQPAYQSNDAERAVDLQHRIQVWADLNSLDPRTEWERLFGEGDQAPVGPKGAALPNLLEFCLERDIPTKDEPDAAEEAEPADSEPADQDADEPDSEPADGDQDEVAEPDTADAGEQFEEDPEPPERRATVLHFADGAR